MSAGIEIAQNGVDIQYATDYQKVLDSRWPTMEIAYEVPINISFSSWTVGSIIIPLFQHNLGYNAAFEFFPDYPKGTVVKSSDNSVFGWYHSGDTPFNYPSLGMQSDANQIFVEPSYFSGDPSGALIIIGLLRIYTVNTANTFKANTEPVTPAATSGNKYGAKVVLPGIGASVADSEPYHFSMNTDIKTIQLHQYGIQSVDPTTGNLTIDHGLGYNPSYSLQFVNPHPSGYFYKDPLLGITTTQPMTGIVGRGTANNYQIVIKGTQSAISGNYAYILYKDPVQVEA